MHRVLRLLCLHHSLFPFLYLLAAGGKINGTNWMSGTHFPGNFVPNGTKFPGKCVPQKRKRWYES